jgi:ABC-type uncharacterized transport system substrate-binding protein
VLGDLLNGSRERVVLRPTIRLSSVVAVLFFAAPLAAAAQSGAGLRVGVLWSAPEDPAPFIGAFRQRLRELGDKGQDAALQIRNADGRPERLPGLAAELVRLNVDVILAQSNRAIAAAQKATTSIPIVMLLASEPVALGFVASLARPGGNITGLSIQTVDTAGKRLQLLKEAVPNLSRVAVLWDPGFVGGRELFRHAEAAAPGLGLQLQLVAAQDPGELDGVFAAMRRERSGAVFLVGSPMLLARRIRIAELAVKHRLPTMCAVREYAEAGCLIAYGASLIDQYVRAAYFVDRILKGAKPADLPVEQPTKFDFVINLRTAKALGLTIPQPLVQRADRLVE